MTKTRGITAMANGLNLTLADASRLAKGGLPANDAERLAYPGLIHGFSGEVVDGASVPAAYDLGLRLLARTEKRAVDRSTYPSRFKWTAEPVAVKRASKTTWHTNAGVKTVQETHDWLYGLVNHPVIPPAVHVETAHTLNLLSEDMTSLGAKCQPRVLALVTLWQDALAHAGVGLAVPVLADLSFRYATSRPELENDIDHWASLLGIPDRGYMALVSLGVALDDEAREVSSIAESWQSRWGSLRRSADEGKLKVRQSPAAMASSLSSMQSASDWHQKWTLTGDTLVARSARWSGHVVGSTSWVEKTPTSWTFAIGDAPCRHRPGSPVTVVLHGENTDEDGALFNVDKTVNVDVSNLGYDSERGTLVTVSCEGKPRSATTLDRAFDNDVMLTLRPTAPNHSLTARARMDAGQRRGRADERSWLAKRDYKPTVRDVPWHVLLSASV